MIAIQYALFSGMLYLILIHFLTFKPKKSIKWINVTIFAVLAAVDLTRQVHYGYQPVRSYDPFLGFVPIVLVALYLLNGFKSLTIWSTIMLSLVMILFINAISTGFTLRFFDIDPIYLQSYGRYNALSVFSGFLLLFAVYQMTKMLKLKINIFSLRVGDVMFIGFFVFLFGFFITDIYTLGAQSENERLGLLISALALLSGIMGIYFIVYIATQRSILKDVQNKENQQRLIFFEQEQNYERMQQSTAEIKAFKHNIENELFHLKYLLEERNVNEAITYINQMQNALVAVNQLIGKETGSRAANTSWYALTSDQKYKSITATWEGKFPSYVSMDSRDEVLLFSNLLSNAFEAAIKSEEKYVSAKINVKENRLSIVIKNSYVGTIKVRPNGDFMTSKLIKKENHGIGTRIIKDVVGKYNGEISFDYTTCEFITLITFNSSVLENK